MIRIRESTVWAELVISLIANPPDWNDPMFYLGQAEDCFASELGQTRDYGDGAWWFWVKSNINGNYTGERKLWIKKRNQE